MGQARGSPITQHQDPRESLLHRGPMAHSEFSIRTPESPWSMGQARGSPSTQHQDPVSPCSIGGLRLTQHSASGPYESLLHRGPTAHSEFSIRNPVSPCSVGQARGSPSIQHQEPCESLLHGRALSSPSIQHQDPVSPCTMGEPSAHSSFSIRTPESPWSLGQARGSPAFSIRTLARLTERSTCTADTARLQGRPGPASSCSS